MTQARLKVLVESGRKKVFAVAVDWPGWARAGTSEEAALATLEAYAARYADVLAGTDQRLPDEVRFSVVERVPGSGATDFGVPQEVGEVDTRRWTAKEAARQVAIMRAAWDSFDRVVASATPVLKKGPRGGGRDRDEIVDHVLGAEASYGRVIGVRHKPPAIGDDEAIAAMRADLVAVLSAPSSGDRIGPGKGWPARYAVRRIVWHVLDHAWEIQDKTG